MNNSPFIAIAGAIILSLTNVSRAATTEDLISQGDVHDAAFEPNKALKFYLPAERATPNDPALLVKIARQYIYRMDELGSKATQKAAAETALKYAQRAVAIAPDTCDPHLSVAICYGKLTPLVGTREKIGISSKLKTAAEKAIQCDPQNDYAWHLLGRWHQALAGIGGVTRSVAKLIYGGIPKASYAKAAECFTKATELNPNRLIHQVELGRTYASMGRSSEARALIKKGLAMPETERDDPATKQRGRETLKNL